MGTLSHRLRAAIDALLGRPHVAVRYVVASGRDNAASRQRRVALHEQLRREVTEAALYRAVERGLGL